MWDSFADRVGEDLGAARAEARAANLEQDLAEPAQAQVSEEAAARAREEEAARVRKEEAAQARKMLKPSILGLIFAFLAVWACQQRTMTLTEVRAMAAQSSAQALIDKLLRAKVDMQPVAEFVRMEPSSDLMEPSITRLPAPVMKGGLQAVQLSSELWTQRQDDLVSMQQLEWNMLAAAAAISADPGKEIIQAWDKFTRWSERRDVKEKLEAREQLVTLGVQPAKLDVHLDVLLQEQNFLLNYTDRVHNHQKDMMLTQVSVDDRRAKAQLQRDGASLLGTWVDEIGCVALSLSVSVLLALHGGRVARDRRQHEAQEEAQWWDFGRRLRPVATGIIQFARRNFVDALLGNIEELIGILALLTAVIVPYVLLVVLNTLLNPASLMGFRPQMLPGSVVLLARGGLSWALAFLLSQVLTPVYGDAFVLGGALAKAVSGWGVAMVVGLFILLVGRGALFACSVMII